MEGLTYYFNVLARGSKSDGELGLRSYTCSLSHTRVLSPTDLGKV